MFEVEYRDISWVRRWGVLRTLRQQSVADHSYYVTLYAGQIADLIGWSGNQKALLRCAMIHDQFEGRSGDAPAPFKRIVNKDGSYDAAERQHFVHILPADLGYYDIWRANPQIKAIIRVADMFEACVFLAEESLAGNGYVGEFGDRHTVAGDLYLSLEEGWRQLGSAMGIDIEEDGVNKQWWLTFYSKIKTAIDKARTQRPRILLANTPDRV